MVVSLHWEDVAVASTTHKIAVTDARGESLPVTPRLVRSLPHPDQTATLAVVRFTPSGTLLTAGYPSGVVQVWDVATGKELRRLETGRGGRSSAAYALTPADLSRVCVAAVGEKVTKLDDPKRKYRIDYDGRLDVWDLATGKPLPPIRTNKGHAVELAELSPDGTRALTVEMPGHFGNEEPPPYQVWLYDTATSKGCKLGEGWTVAAFRPGGREVLACFNHFGKVPSGSVKLFDYDGKELATLAESKGMQFSRPAYSPDGKVFVLQRGALGNNKPASLEVYDSRTRERLASFASGGDYPFLAPAFSHDGRLMAAADFGKNVTIWDLDKRQVKLRRSLNNRNAGLWVAFSPDGTRLAVPVQSGMHARGDPRDFPQPRLLLFDLVKSGEPEECVLPHGWVGDLAFSADGKALAFGSAGAVHVLDVSRRAP